MNKYAVAHISFFHNELEIRFVEADNWLEALLKAFPEDYEWLRSDLNFTGESPQEEGKQEAFNCDQMFDVKEIK